MTLTEARAEFNQLRYDDADFAEQYDDTEKDFQAWIDNHDLRQEIVSE